jgi:hypothetical protein
MELLKSAVSKARPCAADDYFESVLVSKRQSYDSRPADFEEPRNMKYHITTGPYSSTEVAPLD